MNLNADCVRDILLCVEKECGYKHNEKGQPIKHELIGYRKLLADETLNKYSPDEKEHALYLLIQEGYVDYDRNHFNAINGTLYSADIVDLTWKGHDLLDNVRNHSVWHAVKEKAKEYGTLSLSTIFKAAGVYTTALLTDPNALHNLTTGITNTVQSVIK